MGDMNYAPQSGPVLFDAVDGGGRRRRLGGRGTLSGGHELCPPQSGPVLFDAVDGGLAMGGGDTEWGT